MKKIKHEAELFKAALLAGVQYAQSRKAVEFEATDCSAVNTAAPTGGSTRNDSGTVLSLLPIYK